MDKSARAPWDVEASAKVEPRPTLASLAPRLDKARMTAHELAERLDRLVDSLSPAPPNAVGNGGIEPVPTGHIRGLHGQVTCVDDELRHIAQAVAALEGHIG